ncbi:glycosyltransferase family 2 protein [Microvirga arabica]|uniref:glycosyltransferase family 2 protein n=1 Tax=Microvirga arabica TaxID=1128671 RepID=UPI00193AAAF9|nr:glycosyltransferase family 2 protein [Microvirga arabica]MBM1171279.1 glycosyltransferase family 2 protein [Microvirga arabica]
MEIDEHLKALLSEGGVGSSLDVHASGGHQSAVVPAQEPFGPIEFNEDLYLSIYPDVLYAIRAGEFGSGLDHYVRKGKGDDLLLSDEYLAGLGYRSRSSASAVQVPSGIDAALVSESGQAFIVGWVDDRQRAIRSISVVSGAEGCNTRAFGRCRRADVEDVLKAPAGHSFGFWTVLQLVPGQYLTKPWTVRLLFDDGTFATAEVHARLLSETELRSTILGHFAVAQYYGNRDIESFHALDSGVGRELIQLNRRISSSICSAAYVERFGSRDRRFRASLIVCLYGKHEFLFLQNALFARTKGLSDYEFIYVSNSPELSEQLHKEARIAERVYGISLTLVTLPGNAGFSAANNVAARFASSDRVVFVNPDVFPIDMDWAEKHHSLVTTLPKEQTALFGTTLYYDDGSLMHGGMYFEIDRGLSIKPTSIASREMVRVEHFGKGAPSWSDQYTRARPVPAVTGAFISADRAWFEDLGGFNEAHLFGHYEDADLCLKSLSRGVPVWIHDIRFWHLEGKGSIKRPEHEGGSLVNRWLFTRNWGDTIQTTMDGKHPTHPLLNPEASAVASSQLTEQASSGEPATSRRAKRGPLVRRRAASLN